ncbi:carbohydrate ABC transporter permease [Pseudemcibacter aquimaris]|uniref:carbohydrate ABC transporter permease n=1 Tax=Pseudemcibacter aquimaris TaxID=2857064 RepID=UPI0020125A14|nr:carbohydrate ABC transporter permease [Pseudemcibacter aquimaris]MCC3862040.1 carbohydrate ABC transporter permease [Pseudemcibacter aquimaris]WDU58792.1 carbohydrate ABC transporter permease [Pseudemcibacter aquimaris]
MKSSKYAFIVGFLIFTLFPVFWMLKISLTPDRLLFSEGITTWPSEITWDHYYAVLIEGSFPDYFLNSFIVSFSTAILVTVIACLAGYGLSRFNFKGRTAIMTILLITQMFPIVMIIAPIYNVLTYINLVDHIAGLILVYTAFNLPFACFLMQSFFDGLPIELEEAAMIDGYTRFQALEKVTIPLCLPGIGATLGFVFTAAWSELLFALMFISRQSQMTFPAGIMNFVTKFSVDWGQMAAAMILALIPVCIFFAYIQKFIVQGLTAGAVKG